MKVGVFSTHVLWPTHFETDLELIQLEIDKKNEVSIFHCDESIQQCELIWHKAIRKQCSIDELRNLVCKECQLKQKTGFNLLEGQYQKFSIIAKKQKKQPYALNPSYYESHESLKKLVVDGYYDVGWSLLSSIISMYRNPFIDINEHQKELNDLYEDCCRIYYSAKDYITNQKLEKVYVFNGRLSYTKAILCAAKALGIDCYVHERGALLTKYSVFKNHTMHNITALSKEIENLWNIEGETANRESLGKQFYIDRENNIMGSWHSFLDLQDINKLPENWDDEKKNITLFTSSEDEFASISDEWAIPLFKTQTEGIRYVINFLSKVPNAHLYIRIHPNVKDMSESYRQSISELGEIPGVTLINYDSEISSYQLLKKSKAVITFGSTVGIEAVYWKIPSILLGKALYFKMKGPYIPYSLQELDNLLSEDNLQIPAADDALKFGFFMKTYGFYYKYYNATGVIDGLYKNVNLNKLKSTNTIIKDHLRSVINLVGGIKSK